jgi:predicted tellurium resistance membrane protein TerC
LSDLFTAENLVALLTLTALEVVLGIDNIVFIAILCARLPPERRESARRIGLFLAMFARIALLLTMGWLAGSPPRSCRRSRSASSPTPSAGAT